MTAPDHLRKGWCPGALRPMRSGDGLLLRIRPRAGALAASALAVIAETAERFGSGEIELTNRANVQLRGLDEDTHASAIVYLNEARLIDADVGIESVRNIIVDPLSGLTPLHADVRPLADDLERLLASNVRLHQLPGKFGFSFSGSADPCLSERTTDIMLAVLDSKAAALVLDGEAAVEAVVSLDDAVAAIGKLAEAFLTMSRDGADHSRMADAVAHHGAERIFRDAGLRPSVRAPLPDAALVRSVGRLVHEDKAFAVGIGFPFGRIDARGVRALHDAATRAGVAAVRVGPDRSFVFPIADDGAAEELLAGARQAGFVTDADDPRLRLDVCSGAPGCANATTRTREDAARLIDELGAALDVYSSIHVSGCQKGCAHRGSAALTLVAREGHYDAVFDGGPADSAAVRGIEPEALARVIGRVRGEWR
ncbi:precorrin-3B synthase [Hyphomicrobium methylovorum]|uniref:precorrin-3B synthase n=1 Tax=Hyphomicrobium methylovorum TaxID=84 RepID=UPI0015E707ED|nr:precorrin-3B synthase [Hyphomicrobium methylovorum]MBA2126747.1 precorrin-3B synthase [Hyphomicrobium methylovorum]